MKRYFYCLPFLVLVVLACGGGENRQLQSGPTSASGKIAGKNWNFSVGEALLLNHDQTSEWFVILHGPIAHTPCSSQVDPPTVDARTASFKVGTHTGTYKEPDLLFLFNYPNDHGGFTSSFSRTAEVTIETLGESTMSGKLHAESRDNKSALTGDFTITLCQ